MANAHLEGDPRQPMARVSQVKSALQEASRRGGPSAHALVLAGDLNALLGEDVAFENRHAVHTHHSETTKPPDHCTIKQYIIYFFYIPPHGWPKRLRPYCLCTWFVFFFISACYVAHNMLFVGLSQHLPQGR